MTCAEALITVFQIGPGWLIVWAVAGPAIGVFAGLAYMRLKYSLGIYWQSQTRGLYNNMGKK